MPKILPNNLTELIAQMGASSLPDNPSQNGYTAKQIKNALNRPSSVLANWLAQLDNALVHDVTTAKLLTALPTGDELAEYDDGVLLFVYDDDELSAYVKVSGSFTKIGDGLQATADQIDALQALFTDGKAKKAIADEDGNNIKTTYATNSGAVHKADAETITGKKTFSTKPAFSAGADFNGQVTITGQNLHIPSSYNLIYGGLAGVGTVGVFAYGFSATSADGSTGATFQKDSVSLSKPSGSTSQIYTIYFPYKNGTFALTSDVDSAEATAISSAKDYTDGKFSNDAAFQKDVSVGENVHVYGDAVIEGGLVVKGTNTSVDSTTVSTKDVNIELAKGNTTKLTQIAGLHITNYDGSHTGGIGLNSDGFMLIGDMTKNQDGTLSRGDAQEAATRADHGEWSDGELPVWDAEGNTYVPSGKNFASITAEINEGLATKQNTLVSGTNIKTINGQSLVGGGDIMINSLMGIEFVDVGDYRYAVAIVSDDFDGEVACEDIGDYKYLTITYEEVI